MEVIWIQMRRYLKNNQQELYPPDVGLGSFSILLLNSRLSLLFLNSDIQASINIFFGSSTFHPLAAYFFCLAHGPPEFQRLTRSIFFYFDEDKAKGIIFFCILLIFQVGNKPWSPFFLQNP